MSPFIVTETATSEVVNARDFDKALSKHRLDRVLSITHIGGEDLLVVWAGDNTRPKYGNVPPFDKPGDASFALDDDACLECGGSGNGDANEPCDVCGGTGSKKVADEFAVDMAEADAIDAATGQGRR